MAPPPVPMDAYTCLHDPYTVAKTEAYGKQVRVQTHSHSQESACSAGGHRYSGQSAAARLPLTRRAAALQTYSSQLVDPLTSATYGAFSTKRPATVSEGSRRSRRSKGSRGSRSSRGLAERHPNRPHSVSGSRSSGDSFFDKPSSRGSDPTGLLDGCVPLAAAARALCKAEQLSGGC